MLQLASTNRETKEQLKFFRDSGGNIVQHFPPEDDSAAQKALKEQVGNLEMLVEDEARGQYLAKTSIGNLVKICRPPVILDEGHKATSDLARRTIEEFNASVVVELSATPKKGTNIICRVTGQELLDEQMIKLPLNIATSGQKSWRNVLTQARDKRLALERKAHEYFALAGEGRLIRPIVLVQVERTGKDQREARVRPRQGRRGVPDPTAFGSRRGHPHQVGGERRPGRHRPDGPGLSGRVDHHQERAPRGLGLSVRVHLGVAVQHGQRAEHDATCGPRSAAALPRADAVCGAERELCLLPV